MKVHALFGDESALMDRILALRAGLAKNLAAAPQDDATRKSLSEFDAKVDATRKLIVATTEGGAITGEERLREHTDQLYNAILSYDGKPADYQVANIDALRRELDDVTKQFEQVLATDLPALNETLKAKGQPGVAAPPAKVAFNGDPLPAGFAGGGRAIDPDADARVIGDRPAVILPVSLTKSVRPAR